ncbi:hypothetical protein D3C80_1529370 [compost metagenome]
MFIAEDDQRVPFFTAVDDELRQFFRPGLRDKGSMQRQAAIAQYIGNVRKILRQLLKKEGVIGAEENFDLPRETMLLR